ncbi:MAG: gamma carbonic anhydrase family protein [Geobacteraceae bacterium]|nr:gamma carbonic anhydrase family protein [Geobacteraceae bacterium]
MIKTFRNIAPSISKNAFISETAVIIGDVSIGSMSSIWYNVVIRGDVNSIIIGSRTNIQDNSLLHVTGRKGEHDTGHPLIIGDNVTIGHCVTLHGCTVEHSAFVGMRAIVLDRVRVGRGAMIAAGSLVTEGTVIPPETLWIGSPARYKRNLTVSEIIRASDLAESYVNLSKLYINEIDSPI